MQRAARGARGVRRATRGMVACGAPRRAAWRARGRTASAYSPGRACARAAHNAGGATGGVTGGATEV
eukprot:3556362-Prymnesium_polylepis.1